MNILELQTFVMSSLRQYLVQKINCFWGLERFLAKIVGYLGFEHFANMPFKANSILLAIHENKPI